MKQLKKKSKKLDDLLQHHSTQIPEEDWSPQVPFAL